MAATPDTEASSLARAMKRLGAVADPVIGLLDHLPEAYFWIKDTEGCFRWVNTAVVLRRGRIVGSAGLSTPVNDPGRAAGDRPFLGAAIQYIDRHFNEPVKNATLARICGMSLGNFQRQFRATYHCSPHTYVRELRVRLGSRALVHSERSLAAIAEEHGFADQSHFNKEFRLMMKETPRAYRQRLRK